MNLRIQSSDFDNLSLILTSFDRLEIQILKAWLRRCTSQEPNQMLIKENKGFFSICMRFGSCEVRRLNLALVKANRTFRKEQLSLYIRSALAGKAEFSDALCCSPFQSKN